MPAERIFDDAPVVEPTYPLKEDTCFDTDAKAGMIRVISYQLSVISRTERVPRTPSQ